MTEKIFMKCGCEFDSGQAVADKVRRKGKEDMPMPIESLIECACGSSYKKQKLVDQCPACGMTYAVTPCSAKDPAFIVPAGINY